MTLVRVVREYTDIPLMRQTPGGLGVWDGIRFTEDPVESCDYVVLVDTCAVPQIRVPAGRIWALIGEPPNEHARAMHRGLPEYDQVGMMDPSLADARRFLSQPALPWRVGRSYDELAVMPPPDKAKALSWVTSDLAVSRGHRERLEFLERLRSRVEFDLFGRGYTPIQDKWEGLAPYRYTIAVENFRHPFYWSEKIVDALLAWAMPIYCGCNRIAEYFPKEAFVSIDIADPDAPEIVREAIDSDRYLTARDAIAYARELILDHYQLFPFLVAEIRSHERRRGVLGPPPRTRHVARPLRPRGARYWWSWLRGGASREW
ncbi:MAG: glycosyltransferase family 10 domain-containing protein [Betaproteobacteria bacterium]